MIEARALLFDCDGVLVDSLGAVRRHWEEFGRRHGLISASILAHAHGQRSRDVIADLVAPSEVDDEVVRFEALEALDVGDVRAAPGAQLVQALPAGAWAIVTSGSRSVAAARLQAAGLPMALVLVSATDVVSGKPAPDGYLMAAAALGVEAADCIVVEDSPTGIAAGKAAGCTVLALSTTHDAKELGAADFVVPDLTHVNIESTGTAVRVLLHARRQGSA